MMVMQREGESVTFLGSSFLVHEGGYLLTTSRVAIENAELLVVPPDTTNEYAYLTRDEVNPVPVEIVARDHEHDVALLKMTPDLDIQMPSNVIGDPENLVRGAHLFSLGVPFGYYRIHGVMEVQSILSEKMRTRNGTRCLIFDRGVHFGDSGGPLISASGGQIVGIVGGVLDPVAFGGVQSETVVHPNLSYAISMEYGANLLREEGVTG